MRLSVTVALKEAKEAAERNGAAAALTFGFVDVSFRARFGELHKQRVEWLQGFKERLRDSVAKEETPLKGKRPKRR